jgi:putative transposase
MVERIVDRSFRMSDELFARIEPLLPKFRKSKKGGRPRMSWRAVLDGVFYVLRTGCQWKALPPEFGSGSTVHSYFQLLVKRRTFTKLWKAALEEYDELKGIDWKWQSMDGAMSKAPLGGEKNRSEPDRPGQAGYQAVGFDGRQRHPLSSRCRRREHA